MDDVDSLLTEWQQVAEYKGQLSFVIELDHVLNDRDYAVVRLSDLHGLVDDVTDPEAAVKGVA